MSKHMQLGLFASPAVQINTRMLPFCAHGWSGPMGAPAVAHILLGSLLLKRRWLMVLGEGDLQCVP